MRSAGVHDRKEKGVLYTAGYMYVSRCTVYMYIWYCEYVYMVYVSGICIINCFTLATHEIAHSDRGSVVKHCKGYSGINSYSIHC